MAQAQTPAPVVCITQDEDGNWQVSIGVDNFAGFPTKDEAITEAKAMIADGMAATFFVDGE